MHKDIQSLHYLVESEPMKKLQKLLKNMDKFLNESFDDDAEVPSKIALEWMYDLVIFINEVYDFYGRNTNDIISFAESYDDLHRQYQDLGFIVNSHPEAAYNIAVLYAKICKNITPCIDRMTKCFFEEIRGCGKVKNWSRLQRIYDYDFPFDTTDNQAISIFMSSLRNKIRPVIKEGQTAMGHRITLWRGQKSGFGDF